VLDPAIPGFELAIEGGGTLLNLVAASGGPFDTWATTTNGLSGGDAAATADPDNDGLDNAVEFVIGGQPNPANPNANSSALAPTISTDANNLIFTYRRTDLALTQPGIGIAAEYGSDLVGWTPATQGVNGVTIVVTNDIEAGVDQVQVSIPKALATGAKMFARLNVVIP
jgi:electron transfer flavoprotein alpha/beta subunit